MTGQRTLYGAPIFLGSAFLVLGLSFLEKLLNLIGGHIPIVHVYPRQLLDWAVVLLVLEIALSVRQLIEMRLEERRGPEPKIRPGTN